MTTSLFQLRKLKYHSLNRLTGRMVTIPSRSAMAETLVELLSEELSIECSLLTDEKQIALTLAKYGLLDLTFACPNNLLGNDSQLTPSKLRELGFYSHRERTAAQASGEDIDDKACLEAIMEDIRARTCLVKLFLTPEKPREAMMRIFNELSSVREHGSDGAVSAIYRIAAKIDERFPITLVIEDACVTNSDSIWSARHAYL